MVFFAYQNISAFPFSINVLSNDFSVKYSSYLLFVHLMSFFLFHQQFQVNDPQTSVEGSQRYWARNSDNNKLHEEFLIPVEENILLLKTAF